MNNIYPTAKWSAVAKIETAFRSQGTPIMGTAFLVAPRHLVTAAHCVSSELGSIATTTSVYLPRQNGGGLADPVKADVVLVSPAYDLAILEMKAPAAVTPFMLHSDEYNADDNGDCEYQGYLAIQTVSMPPDSTVKYSTPPGYSVRGTIMLACSLSGADISGLSGSPVLIDGKVYAVLRTQHRDSSGDRMNAISAVPVRYLLNQLRPLAMAPQHSSSNSNGTPPSFIPNGQSKSLLDQANQSWKEHRENLLSLSDKSHVQVNLHAQSIIATLERFRRAHRADSSLLIDLGDNGRYPEPCYKDLNRGHIVVAISNLHELPLKRYFRLGNKDTSSCPIRTMNIEAVKRGVVIHRIFHLDAPWGSDRLAEEIQDEITIQRECGINTYWIEFQAVHKMNNKFASEDFVVYNRTMAAQLFRRDNQDYAGLITSPERTSYLLRELRKLIADRLINEFTVERTSLVVGKKHLLTRGVDKLCNYYEKCAQGAHR